MSFDNPSSPPDWQPTLSPSQQNHSSIETKDSQAGRRQPSASHREPNLSPLDTNTAKLSTLPKTSSARSQEKSIVTGPLPAGRNPPPARSRGLPSPSTALQSSSTSTAASTQILNHSKAEGSSPTTPSQGVSSPTSSSFDKISAAQLSILLDATHEKEGQSKWESKSDRIHNLLDSNGAEVLTVFIRKSILLNHSNIFSSEQGHKHPSYTLLREKISEIHQNVDRAFHIVDAIDAAREDLFQSFDLGRFIQHFVLDLPTQLILGTAFTSSIKPSIQLEADHFVSLSLAAFAQSISTIHPSLQTLPSDNLALLITLLALTTELSETQRQEICDRVTGLQTSGLLGSSEVVMSASQLWKLPDRDRIIIDAFKKAGPRSAASRHNIDDVLSSLPANAFVPSEISNALLFMIFSQPSQHYNSSEFVSAIKSSPRSRQLNWNLVIKGFDVPDLRMNADSFSRLFRALQQAAADNHDLDIQRLWGGKWEYPRTQLSFLRSFFSMQDVPIGQIPGFQPAFQVSEFERASSEIRARIMTELSAHHNNLYAMKAVFEVILSSDEMLEDDLASSILHDVVSNHLLGFLLSLVHITSSTNNWTVTQEKFVDSCFRLYLEDQRPDANVALAALFQQDKQMVHNLCIITFHADPRRTEIIYRKAQELDWLNYLLESFQTPLALDIACLMQKEQADFDLETWVSDAIQLLARSEKMVVGNTLWKFLRIKADDEYRSQKEQAPYQSIPLSLPAIFVLLWKVQELLEDREQIKAAQCTCLTTYPRLMNYGQDYDSVLERASEERGHKLAAETDQRMSDLFGQMYRSEVSIRDMINEMRRYKTSKDPDLQDLFCCIVHGLFDEYGCYGEYPEDALEKTALLFGSIIKFKLLPEIPQEYGLTLIVDAVKDHPTDTPMHRFGVEALLQVGDQLAEWPKVCALLLQTPTLQHPEIIQRAQEVVRSAQLRGGSADHNGVESFEMPNGTNDELAIDGNVLSFHSIHADEHPIVANFIDPDQQSQDKILFSINNLSKENMDSKLTDLRTVLQPEHFKWFASYLVEQRARLELNNQIMYCDLLSLLDDTLLSDSVLRETYISIVKAINSKSSLESSTERSHLKNLASWLGLLTLAQDKPIKHQNINFTDLLLEGYQTERLIVVIPFTCKVLVQGARSVIFKPPNPWVMEILGVLIELYNRIDLHITQKFEIEVLCNELAINQHKDIEEAYFIREFRDRKQQQQQLHEDMANAVAMENIDNYDLTIRGGRLRETYSVAEIMQSLPDLDTVLRYPPPSGSAQDQVTARLVINRAVSRAIEEIIAPVVERSITIASLSTSQLVAKDYAMEANPDKLRDAAQEMVKSLAGSLALVTCKEPLRMSITTYIDQHLEEFGPSILSPGQKHLAINDNLDVAAQLIKDAAEQRAQPEMDQVIEPELAERRRFQAENPGGEYYSQALNRWSTFIPEPYKMLLGGLNEQQRAVYEDFERRVHGNAGHVQNASIDSTGRQLPDVLNDSLAIPNLSTPAGQPALPHQSPMTQHEPRTNSAMPQQRINGIPDSVPPHERIYILIDEMRKAARASSTPRMRDLSQDSTIAQDFRQILRTVSSTGHPALDHVARQVVDKITNIFTSQPPQNYLEAESLAFLLIKMCDPSESIMRDVMRWITNNEENLLGNSHVTGSLIHVGLMEFARVDSAIAGPLREHSELALRLLRDLMDQTLFNDEPLALRADFVSSIIALYAWLSEEPDHPVASEIRDKLKAHGIPEFAVTALSDKAKAKEDQMAYVFSEWSALYDNTIYHEATYAGFLKDLHNQQIINSTEDLVAFLRLSIDAAIFAFEKEAASFRGSYASAFSRVDSLALLIILLVKFQGEEGGAVRLNKPDYLSSILSLVVLIVNNHSEIRGVNFNQRVFNRLFSSVMHLYAEHKLDTSAEHNQFMMVFAKTLKSIQPSIIPAFAFSWTGLVCHRVLVEGVLRQGDHECTMYYRELLGLMLQYPMAAMNIPRLQSSADALARGVWKNFYVLQMDFPDFICENHAFFCARVSFAEPMIRNLILSAQPFGLSEPDPLAPNLRVERLEDMKKAPILSEDVSLPLEQANIMTALAQALKKPSEIDSLIKRLVEVLENAEKNKVSFRSPSRDSEVVESLVAVIGQDAVNTSAKFDAGGAHFQILAKLIAAVQPRQKYLVTVAIFDQLRYPNSQTQYFCKVVFHLWSNGGNSGDDGMQMRDYITRVLMERIESLRPVPWGSLVVFKELSDNPIYEFWDQQPFLREPELRQRLLVAAKGH